MLFASVPMKSGRQRQSGYHSPLRVRQAAETRQTVLVAATRLFTERGWAGTTLAAVAAEAGTAVETVYSAFGSKSGLLIAAIDVAIVGRRCEVPLVDRPEFASLGVGERSERLAAAARIITRAFVRRRSADGSVARGVSQRRGIESALGRIRDRSTQRDPRGPSAHPRKACARAPGRLDLGACQPRGLRQAHLRSGLAGGPVRAVAGRNGHRPSREL